jgi:lysophospholipase L1-like esterase
MPLTDQLPPWLAAAKPDVVLMHLGTNDMWGGYIPLADKLSAFTKLVGQMRAANPAMKIVVAQTGGFQDEVAIRNSSSSPATGWTATFTFPAGQQITQAWNATATQTGATVTARNATWNGNLAAATTSFGFTASSTGSNLNPAVTCTLN